MRRILLDSNIYGLIAKELDPLLIQKRLQEGKDIVFYGMKEVIRKELRKTPKDIHIIGKTSLRLLLLILYDNLVKDHNLSTNEKMEFIAERYIKAYKAFGGAMGAEEVRKDFLIIACSSVNHLDVVVSDDNKTMLSENARKAYGLINGTLNLRTPSLINYNNFKRWFSL